MSIVFACAASHTPGIRAWPDAPPAEIKERFFSGLDKLGEQLRGTNPDAILIISSEHFANFFLDGMPAFTIGQGESHFGPVEPWLNVTPGHSAGHPALAARLLDACFASGFEIHYSQEPQLDHGHDGAAEFFRSGQNPAGRTADHQLHDTSLPLPSRCYSLAEL